MGNEQQCPAASIEHELLIFGYGTRDGVPVWKVKNQWGHYWGDEGYAYLERGFQGNEFGTCGIESFAYTPIFSNDPRKDLRCTAPRHGIEIQGAMLKTLKVGDSANAATSAALSKAASGTSGATGPRAASSSRRSRARRWT